MILVVRILPLLSGSTAGFLFGSFCKTNLSVTYSEKWLTERRPGLDENPLDTHKPDGKIFCIIGMAVHAKYRRKGYGVAVLDRLIQIARNEKCTKIVLETTHAQGSYLKRNFKIAQSRAERGITLDTMALDLKYID